MDKDFVCCNRVMKHKDGYYECEVCKKQIDADLTLIKKALKQYPNASALDIAQYTNISSKKIIKYMKTGNLILANPEIKNNINGFYVEPQKENPRWYSKFLKK